MNTSARKVGRPSNNIDAREKLITHARELFTVMPYDKVSTRLVASRAKVNVAMIRYYFGNKEGLFETMLRDTLNPMRQQVNILMKDSSQKNFVDIMRTYYREMIKVPQFPRLISQVMHMDASDPQRQLLEKVFTDITAPMQVIMYEKMVDSKVIKPDFDPTLCKVSYISLMVFPFIAPPSLLSIHGIELNEAFVEQLLEHNIKLMTQGFLNADNKQEVPE